MPILFKRKDILARQEDFGWIVALPNATIDFYDYSVSSILDRNDDQSISEAELIPHLLQVIKIKADKFYLRHPLIVSLEVTRKCSLACPHCYINAGLPRDGEMSRQEIFDLLDELARCGVFCLQITGGEPLERPDILDIIEYAHVKGFALALATNGIHLTPQIIEHLPRKNFCLGLSIDGISANEKIRGNLGKFEFLSEKAIMLRNAGITFEVMLTLNKINLNDAPNLIRWCHSHNIFLETLDTQATGRCKQFPEIPLTPEDVPKDLEVFRLKEELEDYLEDLLGPREGLLYTGFLQFCYWINKITRRCKGGRSMAYITSNGDVYPCSNCASEEILLGGNLRKHTFTKIWNNFFEEIRSITWEDFEGCNECEISHSPYYCCARCPALSHGKNDSFLTGCGASDFVRLSTKLRTHLYMQMHQEKNHIQINPARVIFDQKNY